MVWVGTKSFRGTGFKGTVMKKKKVRLYVTCGTDDCPNFDRTVNIVNFEAGDDVEAFIEGYGNGSEEESDYCHKCGNLGILGDPSE